MKKWKLIAPLLCLSLCTTAMAEAPTPEPQQEQAKWVFLFKSPLAKIKQVSTGKFELVIRELAKTKIYMLNDRPFYLIRTIANTNASIWKSFSHSNFTPDKQVTATLILNNQATEVLLSHFQLHKDYASYQIQSASKVIPLKSARGSMELFISMNSRPLCNMINSIRHDAILKQ